MQIVVSPSIRILPPSYLTRHQWWAEDLLQRKRFRISRLGAFLLISCSTPQDNIDLQRGVSQRLGVLDQKIKKSVDLLMGYKLLLKSGELEKNKDLKVFRSIINTWASSGWSEAAEYHLATLDYPYIGGDEDSYEQSLEIMMNYSKEGPDTARFKLCGRERGWVSLPTPNENLLPSRPDHVWEQRGPHQRVDWDTLSRVLSLTCCSTGSRRPGWSGEPLLLRTSPSGGGRHPIETYFLSLGIEGLPPGLFHVVIKEPGLERLGTNRLTDGALRRMFPVSFARAPFAVAGIAIFTSVFERNMYRYREPRTFRTVHMDAGHVAATFEFVCKALGIRSHIGYGGGDESVEKMIRVNPLLEGFMCSISIG